jgi:SpoVK/Ycf46/Vps4 family AAA+-type ATPase
MSFTEQLELLIRSRYPVIYIPTHEEERAETAIRQVADAGSPGRVVYLWDMVNGYEHNKAAKTNPLAALDLAETSPDKEPAIFVLRDMHRYLNDPSVARKVRNVARTIRSQRKTVILLCAALQIPPDLTEEVTVLDFALPKAEDISREMERCLAKTEVSLEAGSREALVKACLGLSLNRVRQVLSKTLARSGVVDERAIALVLEEKRRRIRQTEVLEFHPAGESLDSIGGMDNLKLWLNKRTRAFTDEARRYGLPNPRGVLLVGIQGTGKSLCAKAIAQLWRLPLLRLDVGRLMASLVGESEGRTREMIRLSEAMAPCVLWVDEIDKAFAGITGPQGDSGVSSRVFGTFINWLSEKTSPVFVAATANDVTGLPPELLRKGRFDEIFFISLPNRRERREIFQVHLGRVREHSLREFDLDYLAGESEGYSGAEIEQAIVEAMYDGFDKRREFNTNDVIAAMARTVPLSRTAREQITKLRSWAAEGRARPAGEDSEEEFAAGFGDDKGRGGRE